MVERLVKGRGALVRFLRDYGIYGLPLVFLAYLALESFQIDFRAFFLAGRAVLTGLDPYLNHVGVRPEFYAPINAEDSAFSAFRYPPLAALVFAPLALLPYGISRLLFTLVMWLALALIAFQMVRRSGWRLQGEALLFAGISFPVLAMVERGQVDPALVLLVLASYWLAARSDQQGLAGFLLAFAGVLKIFPFVVLIDWIMRRRWRLVSHTLLWGCALFLLPWLWFGEQVYRHFWQRTFPQLFGAITMAGRVNLHGQGVDVGRLARALEGHGLTLTRDFTNGFMNPLLQDHSLAAISVGLLLTMLFYVAARGASEDLRFYGFLNVINLFNPLSWIMGLVWYLPLFFHLYARATALGRWLILLPLFLPPFLNCNAVLAYLLSLLFLISQRSQGLSRRLLIHGVDPQW
jgi:hypothetical protein